jgi:hypothetical protein
MNVMRAHTHAHAHTPLMFALRRYREEDAAHFTNTQVGLFVVNDRQEVYAIERAGAECNPNELYQVYPANPAQSFFNEFPPAQYMFVFCNGKQVARVDSHDVYPYFKLSSDATTINRVSVCFAASSKEAELKIATQ